VSSRPDRGSYLLLLAASRTKRISIGSLGRFEFPQGYYCYTGSAMGSGGLASRLVRHKRRTGKSVRWHIDYLRAETRYTGAWYDINKNRECEFASMLADAGGSVIVPGFGSSDCRCPSHLLHFEDDALIRPLLDQLMPF